LDLARDDELRAVLAVLAPGSVLREGIERVIRAGRGALLVIGWTPEIQPLVSGGFVIDIASTSQRIAELAKMDGALVLDGQGERILRANVHLVPDPRIETQETGTRHRSAERSARQTGAPVITVSESMGMVTLYLGDRKRVVEEVSALLVRANQALSTLERYRYRLDEVSATLSAREVEDAATVRDALLTLQRAEMMRRIAAEVEDHVVELGSEGRLIRLQLDELVASVTDDRELLVRDYLADRRRKFAKVLEDLTRLTTDELLDTSRVAEVLSLDPEAQDRPATPRGYRLLTRIPRLPAAVIERLVERFATFPRVMEATVEEFVAIEGIGNARARAIQEGLRRLAEASLLERYV
jgi:diadenylate cyclase